MAAILRLTLRWPWDIKKHFYSRPWLFNLPVQLADKYLACLGGYAFDGGYAMAVWGGGGVGTHKGFDNTFRHDIFLLYLLL